MIKFSEHPAVMMMVDRERGDLFAVITDDRHYVVRLEENLPDADKAARTFRHGYVGVNESGAPVLLRLHPHSTYTPCTSMECTASCDSCGGIMKPAGNVFVCKECGGVPRK